MTGSHAPRDVLHEAAERKSLQADHEFRVDGDLLTREAARLVLEKSVGSLRIKKVVQELGGSPAKAAEVAHALRRSEPSVAHAAYFGTYPLSVQRYAEQAALHSLFASGVANDRKPSSIAYEIGNYKLMLANTEGRKLSDLKSNGGYLIDVERIAQKGEQEGLCNRRSQQGKP